jgi:TAG lipase/steryl ester hydrolase/phospholipase A2/LPA acyltransferase
MALSTSKELKLRAKEMNTADNYTEWRVAAILHDEASGMDQWKETTESDLYDYRAIRTRLDNLRRLRAAGDDHGLLFALNEGIHGNMGGMGRATLYNRAKYSTKRLIVEYTDEIVESLDYLASLDSDELNFEERLEFFRRASHCYGRTALMLSGGGMLGFFHLGVVKSLVERDLMPSVISGASAGSIMAAVLGAHSREELRHFFDPKNLEIEARTEADWINRIFFGARAQINEVDLKTIIARLVPDLTFQQAYEKTGLYINISVAPAEVHQTSRLLNAITSPNVCIRSAVMASCSVPGVFPTVTLRAFDAQGKEQDYLPQRKWIDGSLVDDMPTKRLTRLFGVNHFLTSQTNPVVLLLMSDPQTGHGVGSLVRQVAESTMKEWVRFGHSLSQRYTPDSPRFNLIANTVAAIFTQEYTADINIIPRYRLFDPRDLFSPLSEKQLMTLIREGERASWPKLEALRNCSKISTKLDQIVKEYEAEAMKRLDEALGHDRDNTDSGAAA